jgi:hypothetical protein
MQGDELVPGLSVPGPRAISIASPPQTVWARLIQAGFGRAGFYSNDLLDNAGHPSAGHLIEELQHPRVGGGS